MRVKPLVIPVVLLAILAVVPLLSLDIPRVLPGALDSPGTLQLLALCLVFAGVALSYDLLFGFTGLLSFGHALYFALGVYLPAIALTGVGLEPAGGARAARGFRNAISDPSHPDRARYIFRPGRDGEPPNNWTSPFGGAAWTLDEASGEWYLQLFTSAQPDLDWHNELVQRDFEQVLRFWLDRGIDGFRIDVAQALFKARDLRDVQEPAVRTPFADWHTGLQQPELHGLYRRWRDLADEYEGDRMYVAEIVIENQDELAEYVRPDELQLAFNFLFLHERWDAEALRRSIDRTRTAFDAVGAPPSWVLENHDVTRVPTRYGGGEEGRRRARAAALLLLGLPGAAFVYQGQELGLAEVDIPDELRQDPVFFRTNGARPGRDGCRVPIPWRDGPPGFGFTTGEPWLPMPDAWRDQTVEAQLGAPGSTLELYRRALALRRDSEALRHGLLQWRDSPPGTLVFERTTDGETIVCGVNVGGEPLVLPDGELLLASEPGLERLLPAGAAAWLRM